MRTVKIAGDWLLVNFPYDAKVVGGVKEIPGRVYDPVGKLWKVPIRFLSQARERLATFGFIWDEKLMDISSREKITSIKSKLPLYNFQKEGVLFILNNENILLGDEPGLGKTIQALAAIQDLKCEKVLWVTMKSLVYNAEAEIKKWMPEAKITIVDGDNRMEKYKEDSRFYILNYEKVRTDVEVLRHFVWDMRVMDEVTKIQNPRAKVSKAMKLINAKRNIAMTGTPISNTPADLWNVMDTIVPGLLGSWWQFIARYTNLDYFGHVESYKNLDFLQKVIAPYFFRRLKRDVLKELPERVVEDIVFELSKTERKIYDAIKKEILAYISQLELSKVDWGTLNNTLVKLVRLRQCTGHLLLVGDTDESSKMSALMELLETLPKNTIVFTQFAKMANILHKNIKGSLLMTGDTKSQDRQFIVDKFNKAGQNTLVTTEVGGMGLNLQTASNIVNYDLPWSIAKFEQRIGRIERIGAEGDKITVFNLIAKDTVDELVKATLEGKMKTAEEMFGEIKKILS